MAITFGNGAPGVEFTETNNSFYRAPTDTPVTQGIFIESPYGPVNTPVFINSTKDLINTFGIPQTGVSQGNNSSYPYISQEYLLKNMALYVVRVSGVSGTQATLSVVSPAQWSNVITAKYVGSGGNQVQIENISTQTKLNVYFMNNIVESYDYYNKTATIQQTINNNSKYITITSTTNFESALPTDLPLTNLSTGTDDTIQSTDVINSITNAGLDNANIYKLNYFMTTGWQQVFSTGYDTIYGQLLSLVTERKDCMVLGEPPAGTNVQDVPTTTTSLLSDAGYSQTYYPWIKDFDPISGGIILIPPSVQVAQIFANIDTGGKVWIAPQGKLRGGINQIGLENDINKSDMDTLYSQQINPIINFVSEGTFVWGQKTTTTVRSALDRINVRKTAIMIEQRVVNISKNYLFESYTNSIVSQYSKEVTTFMDGLIKSGGIYDYVWNVDNNPALVDQNMVVASLAFKPVKDIEYIKVNFEVTAYSASFNEQ